VTAFLRHVMYAETHSALNDDIEDMNRFFYGTSIL